MHTPRLPVVDWTEAPAVLNGLVLFAERRNLVSARVPSHFKSNLVAITGSGLETSVTPRPGVRFLQWNQGPQSLGKNNNNNNNNNNNTVAPQPLREAQLPQTTCRFVQPDGNFWTLCSGTNYCMHISDLMNFCVFCMISEQRMIIFQNTKHHSPVSLCNWINTASLRGMIVIFIHNCLMSIFNGLTQWCPYFILEKPLLLSSKNGMSLCAVVGKFSHLLLES